MSKLRSVNTKFWQDPFVENLKPNDKLLFLYLLTNPLTNLLGVYEVTIKRICYDTGLTQVMVENGLEGFANHFKAFFIDNYIVLPNWLKNQHLNANMKKAVEKEFNNLPNELKVKLYPNGLESLWNGSESFEIITESFEKEEVEIEVKDKNNKDIVKLFYDSEKEKTNDENYHNFVNFIFGDNPLNKPLEKVLATPEQVNYNNFCNLMAIAKEKKRKLLDTVLDYENYEGKKYKSLYITLRNWLKR